MWKHREGAGSGGRITDGEQWKPGRRRSGCYGGGCLGISDGRRIYYWKYTPESFEKTAVFANYNAIPGVENQLVYRGEDGAETVLFEADGYGAIVIAGERIFMNLPGMNLGIQRFAPVHWTDRMWLNSVKGSCCLEQRMAKPLFAPIL